MATINVLVRWATNTEELRNNLKQGVNQIEATKASVESLARSLGGEKLIMAAHRSVAAIDSIGGAAKLTAAEAQRQFALIDRAMEKMKVTGQTIPDDMRKMRDELGKIAQPAENVAAGFGRIAGAAAAMVAVAVVNWFREGVQAGLQYGDMLVGLRAKTDLSIRDLQILEDIGIDANVSLEQMAKGVQMLQERLANGSAAKGIRELGLSVDAVRQMSPGEMFATIGAEIAKIEDPIRRAEAASKIFGRSWREIIPALRTDMAEAARNAKIVGDAQVEAADRGIDAWNKFWNDQKRGWTAWAGNVLLNVEKVNAAKAALDARGAVPSLPAPPAPRINMGNIVNDVDPELIEPVSQAQIAALDRQIAATRRAQQEQERFNEEMRRFAGPAKGFEYQLALIKFQLNQVSDATLLADQRAIGLLGTLEDFTRSQIPEQVSRSIGSAIGVLIQALPAKTFDESREAAEVFGVELGHLADAFVRVAQVSDTALGNVARDIAELVTLMELAREAGAGIAKAIEGLQVENTAQGWADLGVNIMGAVSAMDAATASASRAKRMLGGAATGAQIGGQLGGPVGAGIGAGVGLLIGLFRDPQKEMIDNVLNPARDEWFESVGTLEDLNAQMLALTGHVGLVKAVFDADTMEEFEAATAAVNEVLEANARVINDSFGLYDTLKGKLQGIVVMSPGLKTALDKALDADNAIEMRDALKDINSELDKQKKKYDDINGLLAKYKIPVFEVKDKEFLQQNIGAQALELRRDYDIARQAGIDMNVFMRAAGKSVNDFVQNAIKMGIEVPESMREVIQVAIDAGEIYDANGKKIDHMDQLGLTFGQTMQTTMATIETVMGRLLLVLEAMADFFNITLPGAAEDGAAGVQSALDGIEVPDLTVDVAYNYPDPSDFHTETQGITYGEVHPDYGAMGGLVTADGIVQHFDRGGKVLNFVPRGIDTQPAMLAVGEGVVNRSGMQALGEDGLASLNSGRGVGGGGVTVVQKFEAGAIQAGVIVSEGDLAKTIANLSDKGLEAGGRTLERFDRRVAQAVKGRRVA